ncbi:MAG: WG repeat-containing protein [Candidatus Obscuribacterales bacterium]|nr:WG repeat-containing protein [Candidatus Obscuribacterales bacterium]
MFVDVRRREKTFATAKDVSQSDLVATGATVAGGTDMAEQTAGAAKVSMEAASQEPVGAAIAPESYGLLRHRLIKLSCMTACIGIVCLSFIDIRASISRKVTVDRTGAIVSERNKLADLPCNLTYPAETWREPSIQTLENSVRETNLCPVHEAGWDYDKYGFVDRNGKVVIGPQFAEVKLFHNGLAAARPYIPLKQMKESEDAEGKSDKLDELESPWGFIDTSGKFVIKPQFRNVGDFSEDGVAPVVLRSAEPSQTEGGLIDAGGKLIFKTKTLDLPIKLGKCFAVRESFGKTGLVDKTGHWMQLAELDSIQTESRSDEFLAELWNAAMDSPFGDNAFIVASNGRRGLVDADGRTILEPRFANVLSFHNDHACIVENGKCGFVDSRGKVVIPPVYDEASAFGDLIAVRTKTKWSVIDRFGKPVTSDKFDFPIFSAKVWFADGLAPVMVDKKCGYINRKGQFVKPPQFDVASPFCNGLAQVWDGQYWRYLDTQLKFAQEGRYAQIAPMYAKTAEVEVPGPLWLLRHRNSIHDLESSLSNAIYRREIKDGKERPWDEWSGGE